MNKTEDTLIKDGSEMSYYTHRNVSEIMVVVKLLNNRDMLVDGRTNDTLQGRQV